VGILTAEARFAKLQFSKEYACLAPPSSLARRGPVRAVLYSLRFVTMETERT